ncbi:MAG: toprim domain-containing protein, partial [Cyclobacteriaceae bacterium]
MEGYFDVIKLHQHGWTNAVASCGTALTEGQAKQLKRYTDT